MSNLKIYEDSKNYTCQVIKLPAKVAVKGLDNLVQVTVQGNACLIGKDSPEDELYFFFPSECEISHEFLSLNDLYRHETLNINPNRKGFFEDNRRVKAIKFKGVISSGFVIPVSSFMISNHEWKVGDEFNEVAGIEICKKYIKRRNPGKTGFNNPRVSNVEKAVDGKLAPEHMDTAHLMKNLHRFEPDTKIHVTYKLHGTSARTFRTLTKRKLNWKEKLAKYFGAQVEEYEYNYVAASRRQLKSVGFEELPNKNHWFNSGDLWSKVAKEKFEGKLNKGEAVYYEIVGKTYSGEEIQKGYSYGFNEPTVYIYRISNINPDGIEVDLPYHYMVKRAEELGVKSCPKFFNGTVADFIHSYTGIVPEDVEPEDVPEHLEKIFYGQLLDKDSILDKDVVEEGFCIRIDDYPKPQIYKIKSKVFLALESKLNDQEVQNIEDEQSASDS